MTERVVAGLFAVGSVGCVPGACGQRDDVSWPADTVVIGDSLLGWNAEFCQSIPDHYGFATGRGVYNLAVNGAELTSAAPIADQYLDLGFSTVILDGGANDVNRSCGCGACDDVLDTLSDVTGATGAMPELVDALREDGLEVVVIGYPPVSDQAWYGFDRCFETLSELDRRYEALADARDGVRFVDLGDFVAADEQWAFAFDHVHPSPRGAAWWGEQLANALAEPGQ